MSRTREYSFVAKLPYRELARCAMKKLSVPGNLKKDDYVELFRLHGLGLKVESNAFLNMIKTKRSIKSEGPTRSVGRPKKLKIEPLSDVDLLLESQLIQSSKPRGTLNCVNVKPGMPIVKRLPVVKMMPIKIKPKNHQILETKPIVTGVHPSSSSSQNTVLPPAISKSTSQRLRSVLLSASRSKFNNVISKNEKDVYSNQKKWKNNFARNNSNLFTNDIKPTIPVNGFLLPDLQSFPDIPQLADVDVNASFDLDDSNNYNMNNAINKNNGLNIDDTLSNQSAIENIGKEQQNFDKLAKMIHTDKETNSTELKNCETLNLFDDGSLLGLQDTLVENDILQNYIETNNIQFMQLPDSCSEVIKTLQFYESNDVNASLPSENTEKDEQFNLGGTNQTVAEFAYMLPCPITGCVWHSHSAALYVHVFTCHQQMLYHGNTITHVFKCQDIHDSHYSTHLQFVQSTIYIITVTFDSYRFTYVATVQHISSHGDYTRVLPTTAVLTVGFLHNSNGKEHSWTGQVQPYCVPIDVLRTDGKCLFIDPADCEQCVIINVKITVPLAFKINGLTNL